MSKISYIINGTCDGYNNFNFLRYSKDFDKSKIDLIDNNDGSNSLTKGKSCYSISIQNDLYILSKIQIIRDGIRPSLNIGFVRFNLVIPINIKLNTNVITILDKCLGIYTDEFVDENFVLIDENRQNSSLEEKVEKLINEIPLENKIGHTWKVGQKSPAYLFVKKNELYSFLEYEKIFQNDYKNYHEIYFIDENDKGENGILNVLKHETDADLTKKVSLETIANPLYTIKINQLDKGVQCIGIIGEKKIHINDEIEVKFIKSYHKSDSGNEVFKGVIEDLLKEFPRNFKKSQNDLDTIEINAPSFTPEKKEVKLIFKNENGDVVKINELKVNISINKKIQKSTNGIFKLVGDQIGETFIIKVESDKYSLYETSTRYNGDPISIRLVKKKDNLTIPLLKLTMVIIVISLFVFIVYKFWPSGEETEYTDGSSETREVFDEKIKQEDINSYLDGDSLLLSKLNSYKEYCIDDTLIAKMAKCIQVRKAIDNIYRDSIQIAFELKGLNKQQNKLLKLILDTYSGTSFSKYKAISDRSKMTMQELIDVIENTKVDLQPKEIEKNSTKISEETTKSKTENERKPVGDPPPNNVQYSDKEFITSLLNGNIDESKMKPIMKDLYKTYNSKVLVNTRLKSTLIGLGITSLTQLSKELKK